LETIPQEGIPTQRTETTRVSTQRVSTGLNTNIPNPKAKGEQSGEKKNAVDAATEGQHEDPY
jgi:hypothetical protein